MESMRVFLFMLVVSLVGCAPAESYVNNIMTPAKVAPTCDAVKEHLVDVGCMSEPVCAAAVNTAVELYITDRLPKDVPFEVYCDIALVAGLLPVDCVMQAQTPSEVLNCGQKVFGQK